jgi:hypothetical protein
MNEQDDDHDEDESKRFDIDSVSDDLDWQPPPAIADLIEQIDRPRCRWVRVLEIEENWFLRWQEIHPEMLHGQEMFSIRDEAGRKEYDKLQRLMPPKSFEVPITRHQAFALICCCWLPDEFIEDINDFVKPS